MEKWYAPTEPAKLPDADKVLVLAPHPDDEVFGCGGAIALYAERSAAVHVHVLTDGAGYAPDHARAAMHATRQSESENALQQLGDGIEHSFASYKDRCLLQESGLIAHFLQLLEQQCPQVVIAPSPWEIHPDHQATARAALAAVLQWMARMPSLAPGLMFYEIGSPLQVNMLVDITSVWALKEQAMRSFPSQLTQQDYVRHIAGLNAYRTYTLSGDVLQAEAFHHLPAKTLLGMSLGGVQGGSADVRQDMVVGRCMDPWTESVLQSASVHAEELQRALVARTQAHDQLLEQHHALQHQLQHQRESMQQRQHALEQELQACEQMVKAMRASSSWRITAPLRALKARLSGRAAD